MDTQQLNGMAEPALEEIERLRAALMVREVLHHARYDAEKSEIGSLRRRLATRDERLRSLEATLHERTRYLYSAIALLGVMLIAAWL